ncbi:hypothetical protein VTK26DRAFT_8809 [Humicola hyalothermophila]
MRWPPEENQLRRTKEILCWSVSQHKARQRPFGWRTPGSGPRLPGLRRAFACPLAGTGRMPSSQPTGLSSIQHLPKHPTAKQLPPPHRFREFVIRHLTNHFTFGFATFLFIPTTNSSYITPE